MQGRGIHEEEVLWKEGMKEQKAGRGRGGLGQMEKTRKGP